MKMLLGALLAGCLASCSQVDQLSDDQLAADLTAGAKAAAKYSLAAAVKKFPAEASKIQADALVVDHVIQKTVIPAFSGAETGTVLRSAIDSAMGLLRGQISDQRVLAVILLAETAITTELTLPANPTDKLTPRTSKAVLGIFTGISLGIEGVFPPPPPPPPTPPK